ncbi:TPA: efflux RND transporter periplasmic adaptor subunit [Elizabethkingia anophelis]|uniref:efflux RND transporter periplasmic adaptor subunit n=1 Tax=Elizabethkingia anophelis TaxID=1117645 RepID=UPI000416A602|nr:efflux RND transporter periplasmic adaptor subunit [Elizabethkingia anophelis]MCT3743698.1 efflux RND transporter periplasmic adaptor subunit [Elizabethkingia anophelis]MDC8025120.1 efflux RND transporter periplasmic adaptor subunit [Elizabethkingia anophelis]MDV3490255.1 efflux RND transporter periplasmic adaptor subunit [Elizabethkingia anophelis]MDV3872549.1 efflux RND transporter periplasmic adaptor subunit [Elizabethkingia anophelis]MDV4085290.1 efflux RND transporter periplasmic adapt
MITKMRKPSSLILAIAAAMFLSSCGQSSPGSAAGEIPAPETDFVTLIQGTGDTQKEYPGNIEGIVNVDVKPQVTGYLQAVLVKEGQYVQKGQPLFRIMPDVYNEQVKNSDAGLKSALAAQATARLEVEKLRPLVDGKVVSDMQLKTAQANYNAATAQVEQAKAALGSSKINANFTLIKAPVSGYIGRIPNRTGTLVSPTDTTALTTLSDISTVQVYFSISEANYITYSKEGIFSGDSGNIQLILADGSVYNQKGRVEAGSGNIDKATGSITMKAIFPNPDKLLRSGGAGKIVIGRTVDNIVQLPITSVKDIQDKFFVFKLADSSKVAMVPIQIDGKTKDTYYVKSGVKAGDKIAVNRIDMLQDGMKVQPKKVPAK